MHLKSRAGNNRLLELNYLGVEPEPEERFYQAVPLRPSFADEQVDEVNAEAHSAIIVNGVLPTRAPLPIVKASGVTLQGR